MAETLLRARGDLRGQPLPPPARRRTAPCGHRHGAALPARRGAEGGYRDGGYIPRPRTGVLLRNSRSPRRAVPSNPSSALQRDARSLQSRGSEGSNLAGRKS